MDGVFTGKKRLILPILCLVCGVFFVGVAIAMNVVESAVNTGWVFLLLFGLAYTIGGVAILLFNRGAALRVDGDHITAKYHLFGRLDCSIDDIAFVLPQLNTLRIRLKSGKQHVIMGIRNPWEVSAFVRRQGFALEAETLDTLRHQLEQIQRARKKELWWVIGLGVLMFANIFIAVLLTGARDMADFTDSDWTRFTIMGIMEALTFLGFFYAASRCGKYLLPMEELKYRLLGAVIASHPLPSNYVAGIYTDENYSGRIVVCGYPNDDSVYYYVEQFAHNFTLQTVHTSEVYKNAAELPYDGFSELIDITSSIISL